MQPHTIVSREEWIAARKAHLAHEKEYHQSTRAPGRGAPRAAMGQGRQGLSVRRTRWQSVAGRPVQGAQPARGAARHVRARLERGLQELLVLGRWVRAHDPASGRARHHDGRDLARAAAKARRVQAAHGLDFRLAVVRQKRVSITTTAFRSRRSKSQEAATTISEPPRSAARKRRESACSIATRPGTSSTPIPATRGAST